MKVLNTEFYLSVFHPGKFPKDSFPQIAFAGRSNVGKSTLINCLLQQKKLAKTSSTPGKTRSVNFIIVNNRFYFVDLPGYGYAKVSKRERQNWKTLIESYFQFNENVRGTIQIVDSRIGLTGNDVEMLRFLTALGKPALLVATKIDKLNQKDFARQKTKIQNQAQDFSVSSIIPFSAVSKTGKSEIWKWIEDVLP